MFVRWQSRKRRTPKFRLGWGRRGDTHWCAILVESIRVDGLSRQQQRHTSRQRHIAYLAGFTESALAQPQQRLFIWRKIEGHLDRLAKRISPAERRRIEAALIAKIGKPPTRARRRALDRAREEFFRELKLD